MQVNISVVLWCYAAYVFKMEMPTPCTQSVIRASEMSGTYRHFGIKGSKLSLFKVAAKTL